MLKSRSQTLALEKLIKESELLYNRGDYKGTAIAALKVIDADETNAVAHHNAGAAYFRLENYKKAIFHSNRACDLNSINKVFNKATVENLCNALITVGRLDDAENILVRVVQHTNDQLLLELLHKTRQLRIHKILQGVIGIFDAMGEYCTVVIGVIHSHRIGHLISNTENFLRLRQLGRISDDKKYVFFATEDPVNRQMLTMYNRHLAIIENETVFKFLTSQACEMLERTERWINLYSLLKGNEYELFRSTQPTVQFTEEEEERGRIELEQMGITKNDWFVCIFARDSSYLNVHTPGGDWSYHDHRDTDINLFRKTIDFIIKQGGHVIRMGEIVNTPLKYKHKRMIHYAGSDLRSDFMDVYLGAKCRFFIGSASGIYDFATAFERPVCAIDVVPIGYKPFAKNTCYMPQRMKSKIDGKYVPYEQIYREHALFLTDDGNLLRDKGYLHERNTSDEIFEATVEMFNRTNGVQYTEEELALLEKYFALYPEDHLHYCNKNPISVSYLKRNYKLFFGND